MGRDKDGEGEEEQVGKNGRGTEELCEEKNGVIGERWREKQSDKLPQVDYY